MHRRKFNAWLAGAAGSAALGRLGALAAQPPSRVRADIYANVGPRLLRYRIADDGKSLVELGQPIVVAEEIQEACQWGRHFYVASSDEHTAANPRTIISTPSKSIRRERSSRSALRSACAIGRSTSRSTIAGEHVLAACNDPSSIAVHRLNADGSIGAEVRQQATLDYRRLCPSNSRHALRPCSDPACARQSGDFRAEGKRIAVASRYSTTPTASSRISSP